MSLALRYVAHSEIGLVRKNNQDSAYASPTMLMVADGMGGAAAGDLASAVAITELAIADGDFADQDMLEVVGCAITRANTRIAELVLGDRSLDGMGTTVCGVLFDGTGLAIANIGDSRGYRLRDGVFERITRDHSWVQTLVDDGRITEEEALVHPHRSLILKVLNGQPHHTPDLSLSDARVGDRLLICSDGLCGLVTDEAIHERISGDREDVLKELVALAHHEGGLDNITIILADVVEGDPEGAVQMLGAAAEIDVSTPEGAEDTAVIPQEPRPDPRAREKAEQARYQPTTKGRAMAWTKVLLGIILPVLVLGGGLFGWYSFTQTKYYVGASTDESVAIFQGVPDKVLGLALSRAIETSDTHVSDLPLFYQDKVRAAIVVPDVAAAQNTVTELQTIAVGCIRQREERARMTASPTPTPTPTTPSPSPSPTGSGSPVISPTLTPSATNDPSPGAPEDC